MRSHDGIDRRGLFRGFTAALAAATFASAARSEAKEPAAAAGRIVRLSRGTFNAETFEEIRRRLESAQKTLIPEIRKLSGCLHYFAAIDRDSHSMIHVSVWKSLADANQMQGFPPMVALAEEFLKLGVQFDRPVINYEELWTL